MNRIQMLAVFATLLFCGGRTSAYAQQSSSISGAKRDAREKEKACQAIYSLADADLSFARREGLIEPDSKIVLKPKDAFLVECGKLPERFVQCRLAMGHPVLGFMQKS